MAASWSHSGRTLKLGRKQLALQKSTAVKQTNRPEQSIYYHVIAGLTLVRRKI
jgi:hypothetical protein